MSLVSELKAARSRLKSLKRQRSELLDSNKLLRTKLQVLPSEILSIDQTLRWLILARVTLSSANLQLEHQYRRDQASFLSVPPPSHWTGPWLQHFKTLSSEAHRFYLGSYYMHIRILMQEPHLDECKIVDYTNRHDALYGLLMHINPMAVMRNMNRHVHTGENSSDMLESVCKRVAAQVPIRLIKPGGVAKLKSIYKLYETAMSRLQAERQALQDQMESLMRTEGCKYGYEDMNLYEEEVASCSHGGSTTREDMESDADVVQSAISLGKILETWRERKGAVCYHQQSAAHQTPIIEGSLLYHSCMEDIVAKLEALFVTTMRERLRLCSFVGKELGHPLLVGYFAAESYPYLVEVPQVVRCFLDMTEKDVCMRAKLAMMARG